MQTNKSGKKGPVSNEIGIKQIKMLDKFKTILCKINGYSFSKLIVYLNKHNTIFQ